MILLCQANTKIADIDICAGNQSFFESIQLFHVDEGLVMGETLQNHKAKGANPVKAYL